jgi:hypothetical protein
VSIALVRSVFVVVIPLALAVVLWWHPPGGDNVYADVRDDVDAWLVVHTVLLIFFPLLGLAVLWLLNGLSGLAATVSRVAVIVFLVFYTALEVTAGIGTGVLVDYANGLPAPEQAAVAEAIQDYHDNPIVGESNSLALIAGAVGWIVAMVAAAVALRQDGASWLIALLVALAAVFAIHPPPFGPLALACLAVAAALIERWRGREAAAQLAGALR